ncbi:MAG: S24/S26 family peptidase [Acholeplasmataceae bacterium]
MKTLTIDNHEFIKIIKEHLNLGQIVSIKVKGNSMLPFFINDKTVVDLKKEKNYLKYDVILAKYNNHYVLHRIIKIKDNIYVLRGDGNLTKEVVKYEDIYAKVVGFKTNEKTIKRYKFKVFLWQLLRPIRRILLKLRRMFKK